MEIPKKSKTVQGKSRLLYLKKIELKNFPELSRNLKDFLWNSEKYFKSQFKNYHIAINHVTNKNFKIPYIDITKRKISRMKTKRFDSSSIFSPEKRRLNDSKKIYINESSSRFDRKRGMTKNINLKEVGLKPGQKYINDFELEDLFNAYKTVREMNKKRDKNFITVKEYMDMDNNSLLLETKTLTNFNKKNNKASQNKEELKLTTYLETDGNVFSPQRKYINPLNTINPSYYKTTSTFMSVNKDEKNNKNINSPIKSNNACSISKINSLKNDFDEEKIIDDIKSKTANNFYGLRTLEEKNIILRKKLIKKQNQFLENEEEAIPKNKTKKEYFANLLANQEQALTKTARNKLKINVIYNLLAKKSHKPKEKLLMTNINSYRIKKELGDKFTNLNSKIEPEHSYNWIKDLREESKISKNNITDIRDPYDKKMNITISNKNLGKKKNSKYYKKLIDETNKINNNFEGLFIKGKNLLKTEYDQLKALKTKKIINNYEIYLPTAEVEDILFTDRKYSNEK